MPRPVQYRFRRVKPNARRYVFVARQSLYDVKRHRRRANEALAGLGMQVR
jgi:hypothetical protein